MFYTMIIDNLQQTADSEPRSGAPSENGRGMVGGNGQPSAASGDRSAAVDDHYVVGVRQMIDRLRRHLSSEKSVSPTPRNSAPTTAVAPRHRFGSAGPQSSLVAPPFPLSHLVLITGLKR